ncbi:MAG: RluA family pseudouridine synthase [Acidimicrobiales bacterium]
MSGPPAPGGPDRAPPAALPTSDPPTSEPPVTEPPTSEPPAPEPPTAGLRVAVPRALAGERLDRVVALLWGLARGDVAAMVTAGGVRVAGRTATTRSVRVAEGDVVEVDLAERADRPAVGPDPGVEVPVVAVDEHVVVVDKPPGLVVHPGAGHAGGTLVNGLLARWPEMAAVGDPARPGIVHRLDAGTSGLLVVARSALAYDSLVAQLAARGVDRRYLALVWGSVESPSGMVDAPVGRSARDRTQMAVSAGGREARTRYRVLSRHRVRPSGVAGRPGGSGGDVTIVECSLETGRTHQIRVHLAAIGHPVVGDVRYGGARPAVPLARPFLHAFELAFDHPAGGRRTRWTSPLPPDLVEARELLD